MVNQLLLNTPVQVLHVGLTQMLLLTHVLCLQEHIQLNCIVLKLVISVSQIIHWLWVLFVKVNLEWSESFKCYNPWGDS